MEMGLCPRRAVVWAEFCNVMALKALSPDTEVVTLAVYSVLIIILSVVNMQPSPSPRPSRSLGTRPQSQHRLHVQYRQEPSDFPP